MTKEIAFLLKSNKMREWKSMSKTYTNLHMNLSIRDNKLMENIHDNLLKKNYRNFLTKTKTFEINYKRHFRKNKIIDINQLLTRKFVLKMFTIFIGIDVYYTQKSYRLQFLY